MLKNYLPLYRYNYTNLNELPDFNSYAEFDIKVPMREQPPDQPGVSMSHQKYISNVMKGYTNVDGLLIVHDMGTGKTCTSIHSIENNIRDLEYGMMRAIILNRGKAVGNNFMFELINKCTQKYNIGSERLNKKLLSKFYTFETFELFAKSISKLSDLEIIKKYNNTFLVIDEVHNILNDESFVYTQISRFISVLPNKKVLLLTGTPVRDVPEDIVPVINLLLKDKINPKTFRETFYDKSGNLTQSFKNKLAGRVSYLKSPIPEISIINEGKLIGKLKKFKVVVHQMLDFQNKCYKEAIARDLNGTGVYTYSRQASRFVFPNGTYGSDGFDTYMNDKIYTMKPIFKKDLTVYGSDLDSILKRISELSIKYAFLIKNILEADSKNEKTIVYDDLVKGSGLIVFSKLLDFVGFKKHRLISSETTTNNQITKIQNEFNNTNNISVILGSRVIAEGLTFLDVVHEHLVPHWNNTETMQVVARGIRMGSHKRLLEKNPNSVVHVYRHVTLCDDLDKSIDYMMTVLSESKDLEISKVINALQEVSISCKNFIGRNGGVCAYDTTEKRLVKYNDIALGFLDDDIIAKIKTYFKNRTHEHFNNISLDLKIDKEYLVKYLHYFISEKIPIENIYGFDCFLNYYQNWFFLTEDIRKESYIRMSYYVNDIRLYSLNKLEPFYEEIVNTIIEPNNIQRLLELAVTIKALNLKTSKKHAVDIILNKYNTWEIDELYAYVWYNAEIIDKKSNVMCLKLPPQTDQPWNEWKKCNKTERQKLNSKKRIQENLFEEKLVESNILYYGLLNPITKEFCIKDLTKKTTAEDRRKISSGKRCTNWNKLDLIKIINLIDPNNDVDWAVKSRKDLCTYLYDWFEKNDLLIEDNSCGQQNKIK